VSIRSYQWPFLQSHSSHSWSKRGSFYGFVLLLSHTSRIFRLRPCQTPHEIRYIVLLFVLERLSLGPVIRLGPNRVDVQPHEIAQNAWGGLNEAHQPWNKDPLLCKMARFGLEVDNLVTIPAPREGLRMRRLIGGPFSRKFLFDQEEIFKGSVKRFLDGLERSRGENDGGVEMLLGYRKYSLDVVSTALAPFPLTFSPIFLWRLFQG
jgi:hypothetical protein